MNEEPKILVSISGGKDSLAALITHIESGGRCDGAIYCRIMFDDETSAEYPEHEDFLFNKCFPTLEGEYGVKTTIVQQSYTYVERFHKVITRNTKNNGRIYGFPFIRGSWCNSDLKLHPLRKFKKETGEFIEIVGIAADETERIAKKTVSGKILPLVEHGITEGGLLRFAGGEGYYLRDIAKGGLVSGSSPRFRKSITPFPENGRIIRPVGRPRRAGAGLGFCASRTGMPDTPEHRRDPGP